MSTHGPVKNYCVLESIDIFLWNSLRKIVESNLDRSQNYLDMKHSDSNRLLPFHLYHTCEQDSRKGENRKNDSRVPPELL